MRNRLLVASLAVAAVACGGGDITSSTYTGTSTDPGGTNGGGTVGTTGFIDRSLVDAGVTYNYKVFIPANYNSAASVPVILFMHGSGEKGTDNVSQTNTGLGPVVKAQATTFPAIVVFPQSPLPEGTWNIFDRISASALKATMAEFKKSDPKRVYLTALSFGGIHSYEVLYQNPTMFAAFVPISAGICGSCLNPSWTLTDGINAEVSLFKTLPIRQYQGEFDTNVPTAGVRQIVAAFKAAGSPIVYTEYPGQGHAVWDLAYADQVMWTWLWQQHR
jgi:predicted peptidase